MIGVLECPLDLARLVLSFSLRVLRPLCGSKILVSNFTTFIFIRRLDTQRQSRCRYAAPLPLSHKSFRTKQKMAKAGKQNRPVPGWIRLRTNNPIRYATIYLRSSQNYRNYHPLQIFDPNVSSFCLQRQEKALEKDPPQHLSNSPLEPHFRIWDCCRKRSTTTMVLAFQR
ncbi:hypothetical protein E4U17_008051 [Claviceps sp. LM77 group G4]|nr:hypothetical protein E4U17_008051 [Claviceps sp. LM77 group G4]